MGIVIYILIYFFLYQNIAFIPKFYGSYYNIFATVFFIFNVFNFLYSKKKLINKKFLKLVFFLFLIILVYFISLIINNISLFEVNPIRNIILRIFLDFNYIVFIINLLKNYKNKEILFFKGIIYSSFIDNIFSILRFKFDDINNLFMKLYPPANIVMKNHLIWKERLMGLGGFFFEAGIILSVSLILIVYLIKKKDITKKEKICLYSIYIFNLLIGVLISRTTIIGFLLSGLYFFRLTKNKIKILCNLILVTILILFVGLILFNSLNVETKEWIINFVYIKGIGSLNSMLRMYNKIPNNMKTFLIGDSLWGEVNTGYYMNTDIGYLRMLFFNGAIGLLFQILFNWNLARVKNKELKKLSNILFVLFLILNLKGFVAYLPICLLIKILDIFNTKNSNFKFLEKEYGKYISKCGSNSI